MLGKARSTSASTSNREPNMYTHQKLHVYQHALTVARWIRGQTWPRGDAPLRDQASRAATSVVLNIAEGMSQIGKPRANHLRIAKASAAEVSAILDLVDFDGTHEMAHLIDRVGMMLAKLLKRS